MTAEIGRHLPGEVAVASAPPAHFVQLAPPFVNAGGFCWRTELPADLLPESDEPGSAQRSPWRLFEDGSPIGFPHALHDDLRGGGNGSYSHWRGNLYFSASDNTDPNTNGRIYELKDSARIPATSRRIKTTSAFEWVPEILTVPMNGAPLSHLADILRRRQVREVVYLHTDHFEPWVGSATQQQRTLEHFAELTRNSAFGRKLSLFYTPPVWFSLADREQANGYHSCDGDNIAFRPRPPQASEDNRRLLRPLEAEIGHEFHIHVHHENWTRIGLFNPNSEVSRWVNEHSTPEADARRLDLFLRLGRATMEEDLGRPFDHWAFVHGNWTLSASDARYCQIETEIAVLMQHGCFGDFTFPAPNLRCQPTLIQTPYTCAPISGAKSYDRQEADPRPISQGAGLIRPDRFFVWNSPAKAADVSLDFFDEENRERYKTPETFVRNWLEQSAVIDGRLYIKTHAHSLYPDYRVWEEDRTIPHAYPDVVAIFELLQRACDAAKVSLVPATVGEVMTRLREFDRAGAPQAAAAAEIGGAGAARAVAISPSTDNTAGSTPEPNTYRLKKPFIGRSGHTWVARLPFEFEADADTGESPGRSQWQLLENGVLLPQAHAAHSEIAELGAGRYSHWIMQLYFSTSDNTDPNTNGRDYALRWVGPGEKPWLAELTADPVAEQLPYGPRPEIESCAGLIAVFGASFSGSTLVNSVLGSHPAIFGGGELHWLVNDYSQSECAICGATCRFWTPEVRSSMRIDDLYHEVSRMFGRSYIVDISKMSSWYLNALPHYQNVPMVRVLLVKHPVRHVASFVKKKDEYPEYGKLEQVLAELRSFYEEFDLPEAMGAGRKFAGDGRAKVDFVIRYEDFVASPTTALAPVLAKLGLEYHPRMALWASAEHHHIGGNVGPRVQIANAVPTLAVSVRKYRQRGIFLDNSYLEILSPEEIAQVARHRDARWIGELFGYGDLESNDGLSSPAGIAVRAAEPNAQHVHGAGEVIAPEGPSGHCGDAAGAVAAQDVDETAIEAEILAFLRTILASEGRGETPIENWYRTMYLDRGHGFAPYGRATIDLLEHRAGQFDRITEIGAGIGQNCIEFALQGWQTVAVESGEEAYGWMERLLARIDGVNPAVRARVHPLKCGYPQRASEYLDERTLACFFGLCSGFDAETERQMIESLRFAGGVILDPRVFFRHRELPGEVDALIDEIKGFGFQSPIPLWDSTSAPGFYPYRFVFFQRAAAVRKRTEKREAVTANTLEADTCIPVAEQIEIVRACIGDDRQLRTLYDDAISGLDIAANEALIRRYGQTKGLSSPLKYIDCAFWIFQKLRLAIRLGLDKAPPRRILDLGTGGGHFCFVCRLLGHDVVGVDIEVPMYKDICALLDVVPVPVKIARGERLPDLGGRFDLITAFAAQFDQLDAAEAWNKEDWRDFVDQLLCDQVRAPGRIFFTLNSLWDAEAGKWVFKEYVAEVFREYGGEGSSSLTSVDLAVTEEITASVSQRRRGDPVGRPTQTPRSAATSIAMAPPFRHVQGFAWSVLLPDRLREQADEPGNHARSSWRLLEDDAPIGQPHLPHDEICALGKGRYSHWQDTLYFSTSDNSDPNSNGRRYSLSRASEAGAQNSAF